MYPSSVPVPAKAESLRDLYSTSPELPFEPIPGYFKGGRHWQVSDLVLQERVSVPDWRIGVVPDPEVFTWRPRHD
jgi:hypothetical protein